MRATSAALAITGSARRGGASGGMFAVIGANPAAAWHEAKIFLERSGAISMDALHVLAGTALLFLFAWALRRSLASWLPWLLVLAVLALNEAADLSVERWPSLGMQLGEAAKDVLVTMAIPTLLLVAVRASPRLFSARGRAERKSADESEESGA